MRSTTRDGSSPPVHAVVSLLVEWQAGSQQGAEAGFIAEQGAGWSWCAAGQQCFHRAIEPHDQGPAFAKPLRHSRLRVGASAERQHQAVVRFGGAAEKESRSSTSICRKAGSPKRSKIAGIPSPACSSMRASRSSNRQASWRARRTPTVVLPEPMNPARHTTRGSGLNALRSGGRLDKESCKRRARPQSRFRILIVPLKEESSTLAWPFIHRAEQALGHAAVGGYFGARILWRSGTTGAWLMTLPKRELAFTSKESLLEKRTSMVPL